MSVLSRKSDILSQPYYYNALQSIFDELYEFNLTDDTYRIIFSNPDKYILPPEQGHLHNLVELISQKYIHPADIERFKVYIEPDNIRAVQNAGQTGILGEFRRLNLDGDYEWTSMTLVQPTQEQGEEEKEVFLCFLSDITLKKRFDEKQERNKILQVRSKDEERYKIIVDQTNTIVFDWVPGVGVSFQSELVNDFEFVNDEPCPGGLCWVQLQHVHPDDRPLLLLLSADIKSGAERCDVVIRLKKLSGEYIWCRIVVTCLFDNDKNLVRLVGTINDVDESVETRKELEYRAAFDVITGIYNQLSFEKHVVRLFEAEPDTNFVILRMDIKRFRFINDLFGVRKGNELLAFIAHSLKECLGEDGICARMGSDIFSICYAYEVKDDIIDLIERILAELADFEVGFRVSAFFGICLAENKTIPVNLLCDWASTAMRSVKGSSVIHYAWYDDKLRDRLIEEQQIENEMTAALQDEQFVIYLQPKHDIETGEIVGAESLVRWKHPKRGLIPPDHFIPLFERNGFILQLDEYVWKQTCSVLKRWIDTGHEPVPISINVSRTHAYDPNFYNKLVTLLEGFGVPNKYIELELTESTFVQNTTALYRIMNDIRGRGFRFSMDDFGSGYSSLNMLKNAPVSTVKFDKDFFNDSTVTTTVNKIVRHMIAMAQDLGMTVIAEGVETEEQADMLLSNGCHTAQGYFFSRPMPVEDFEKLLFKTV